MTNTEKIKKAQPVLPYWALGIKILVIDWSLGIGHWSFNASTPPIGEEE
jgi:hypothetical protein